MGAPGRAAAPCSQGSGPRGTGHTAWQWATMPPETRASYVLTTPWPERGPEPLTRSSQGLLLPHTCPRLASRALCASSPLLGTCSDSLLRWGAR